jgi:hypothetical protein
MCVSWKKSNNLFFIFDLRILMGVITCVWVYVTPYFKDPNNGYPFYYYLICLLINACHSIFTYSMYVAVICFFARISDKKIGGTYMTFLNTLSNIGLFSIAVFVFVRFFFRPGKIHRKQLAINSFALHGKLLDLQTMPSKFEFKGN